MEIYVLVLDMYHEWALENGASDIIGVFDNKNDATNTLIKYMNAEKKEGRILDTCYDLENYPTSDNNNIYVDIYENEDDFNNGKDMGTFKIEKRTLNNKGILF